MSSKRKAVVLLLCFSLCLLASVPAFSQTATGRISGTVKDQSGGAIVGAAVQVTDVARGLTRNLMTDQVGAYLASNLIAGVYTVRATFAGFQAFERTNINLPVGGDLFVDVVLQPGAQTTTVTVTEELPLVNTTSSTLGGTLNAETISDLPLNGRNFTLLLELRPGVILTLGNDSGGTGAASTNGLRPEQSNEYLVEGLHAMSPFNGQPIMNALALRGDAATLLPVDAIQEFNQQFNNKAEYGFRPGGAVNIGLKSGTNAFHGTGYAFFRRDAMDARNYFSPKLNTNLNQYGATFGGPIKKDKLFFFIGYEGQRVDQGDSARSDHSVYRHGVADRSRRVSELPGHTVLHRRGRCDSRQQDCGCHQPPDPGLPGTGAGQSQPAVAGAGGFECGLFTGLDVSQLPPPARPGLFRTGRMTMASRRSIRSLRTTRGCRAKYERWAAWRRWTTR